jgi:hypothetical protein
LTLNALIYLEHAADSDQVELPVAWAVLRDTRAGAVRATLLRRVLPIASENSSLLMENISHEPEA